MSSARATESAASWPTSPRAMWMCASPDHQHGKLLDPGPRAIDAGIGHNYIESSLDLHRGGHR
jgi:hypothetical protein